MSAMVEITIIMMTIIMDQKGIRDGLQQQIIRYKTLYLWFSLQLFFWRSICNGIKAELFEPGLQLMDPIRYNQLFMHDLIMIFGVMPAFVGWPIG